MHDSPVYNLHTFTRKEFYINTFGNHLQSNPFVEKPHRHNFYLMVLFTAGTGTHAIDFDTYPIHPGSLFIIQPGQYHNWNLSADCEGYILFYKKEYIINSTSKTDDYNFLYEPQSMPFFQLSELVCPVFENYMQLIYSEYTKAALGSTTILLNLLDCLHQLVHREYKQGITHHSHRYNVLMYQFQNLLEEQFKTTKSPAAYAQQLHISLKHLNRICQTLLRQTATDMIQNRTHLESKRMLIGSTLSISQIADILGFESPSNFSKSFKKREGCSPKYFRFTQKNNPED